MINLNLKWIAVPTTRAVEVSSVTNLSLNLSLASEIILNSFEDETEGFCWTLTPKTFDNFPLIDCLANAKVSVEQEVDFGFDFEVEDGFVETAEIKSYSSPNKLWSKNIKWWVDQLKDSYPDGTS